MKVRPYKNSDIESVANLFTASVHGLAEGYYDSTQRAAWAPQPPDTNGTQCAMLGSMKPISWNLEKNALLKAERGISFEDVVYHIMAGDILETVDHPNQVRYPGQKIHMVAIEEYVYLVPFVELEDEVFLKTVIPSRKATKTYLGGRK